MLLLSTVPGKTQSSPCDSTILVPNTLSPNGDSVNDCLYVRFLGKIPVEYQFTVYNRWGEQMFDTTDPTSCWDANYKKNPCPMGVYVWLMKYRLTTTDEKRSCSGNITILR